ncbi:MAG: urate hydroxylase PuuD [Myxococcota bacterium]
MEIDVGEWFHLAIRWVHVFAGIMWIGQTYFFTWLDARLEEAEGLAARDNLGATVWMVHSGGFYVVDKQKVPKLLPRKLHWFKYEALLTWLSGVVLLAYVYYAGGAMVDEMVYALDERTAIAIGVGAIVAAWFVYDFFWLSPLGKNEGVGAAVSYLLLIAAAYAFTRLFSGRAAYMHVGALMGTLMVCNVWLRILPAQRQLIAATKEGQSPDLTLASRAKQRSKHNTFMVMPLVFIMLSNHFPTSTFGTDYRWPVLAALILIGWAVAKVVRSH